LLVKPALSLTAVLTALVSRVSGIEVDRVDGVSLLPRKVSFWSVQSSGIARRIVWDVNVFGAFPAII
jgi:hypothetical protein